MLYFTRIKHLIVIGLEKKQALSKPSKVSPQKCHREPAEPSRWCGDLPANIKEITPGKERSQPISPLSAQDHRENLF